MALPGRGTQARLIHDEATRRGIDVTIRPRRLVLLAHGGVTHRFRSGATGLNSPLANRITAQKDVTSRLLRHAGVPAPEGAVFTDAKRAWAWAEPALPVVVKPVSASKGSLVRVGIIDADTFADAFAAVVDRHGEVLVEGQVPGVEHRFAWVDGRVAAVTRRVPMHVVGDGENTVQELVDGKNAERQRRDNPIHKLLQVDDDVLRTLRGDGLSLGSRPAAGVVVWLRKASNISLGGDAVDATDRVDPSHVALVARAAAALPGLRLAGFDVLINGGHGTILEVNSAPMLSMHHFPWEGQPRDVMAEVVNALFPRTRRPE
jgi:D-alanine-D-alanine ligase-like ATP-grasp enzyme